VDPLGIEPRSVSRLVSLSFTCVVAISLTTEFEDSAFDLSPCFSHLRPGSPKRQPDLVVCNPTRYQDYLTEDRLLFLRQQQRKHCRLQLAFSRLIRAGREPLTRERTFHPTSKTVRAHRGSNYTPSMVVCPMGLKGRSTQAVTKVLR